MGGRGGVLEISILFAQFCCGSKTVVKYSLFFENGQEGKFVYFDWAAPSNSILFSFFSPHSQFP